MNMTKLLVTIAVSTFALGSAASFADGTLKLEELTMAQRADMRSRAEQLTAERAANGGETHMMAEKMKKHHAMKPKTDTRY